MPADVYFGRAQTTLKRRQQTKKHCNTLLAIPENALNIDIK